MTDSPTLSEWKALYEAAIAFRKLAPWEWMYNDDLFAVVNPETGVTGYCVVMGALGEYFGLGVYRGEAGWRSLQAMRNENSGEETLYGQHALIASFESSQDVEKRDREVIKQLGLHFRGKTAWPLFRSYVPGYVPWYLTSEEARFLTVALEQAADVAKRVRDDRDLLNPRDPGTVFTRRQSPDGSWEDAWTSLPELAEDGPELPPVDLSEVAVRGIMRQARKMGSWEVDVAYAPFVVAEGERPMFPKLLLCVDRDSGMILQIHVAHPDGYAQECADKLLETMETLKVYPKAFVVKREETRLLLKPIAEAMRVAVHRAASLPALEEARHALDEGLMRRG
ncbi:DUF7309 domain-containing protein [Alicyclobacillus macrosporangiidus]|uniref:Uncharacterized protein n=1 Tax=Alicyclobacillus macrosporangiidus TaxID=392015 RepID=A0A1I7KY01_9BACL|nr:hypothetical protein [Alicyclobacillus macrosporangiidus]SFV02392.1 hypothetical protein SAMN05421543_12110 [Alicyclobacillus macrosporangiidus]